MASFRWVKPPEDVAKAIEVYQQKLLVAIHAIAVYEGKKMQDAARRGAPWSDRTGNARGGLFFAVDGFGMAPVFGQVKAGATEAMGDASIEESGDETHLILTLGHTVFYGKYLEGSNGGRYAVVMSTLEAHLPELERMLAEVVNGGALMGRASSMVSVV